MLWNTQPHSYASPNTLGPTFLVRDTICTPPLAPGQHGLSTDPKGQAGQTQSTLDPGSQGNHQSQGCGE